jgi:hypothetical protein
LQAVHSPSAAPPPPHTPTQLGDGKWSHGADVTFTFNRLQFRQPSQVRPRWLVFAGSLLGGGYVYSQFTVPTVVMSRMAEQFEKVGVCGVCVCGGGGSSEEVQPVAGTLGILLASVHVQCQNCALLAFELPVAPMNGCPILFCARTAPPQAKRVLWGSVEPDCDTSVLGMDYKQLRKYIKRYATAQRSPGSLSNTPLLLPPSLLFPHICRLPRCACPVCPLLPTLKHTHMHTTAHPATVALSPHAAPLRTPAQRADGDRH